MHLTLYFLTYNEELLFQFVIDHYKTRFPNSTFIIFDNGSTDNTVELARKNNCEVRDYSLQSGGKLNDGVHRFIKNNCWKNAPTDWVLVADLDEVLDISEKELEQEDQLGST